MTADKVREWLQTLGLVAIPIVVAISTNSVAKSNATREVNARMIEVAMHVLTGPVNDSTRPARFWAVQVLKRYSDVPFNARAESSLVRIPGLATWDGEWTRGGGVVLTVRMPPCDSTRKRDCVVRYR